MRARIESGLKLEAKYFGEIAKALLNGSYLVFNTTPVRICEIEFYLHSPEHPDIYTHCNDNQLDYGAWYFHRHKNGSFKSGTFKGLDLVLGSREAKIHAGILIRAISTGQTLIEGPCLTVNYLLRCYGVDSILELYSKLDRVPAPNLLDLEFPDTGSIWSGPRIGLKTGDNPYHQAQYRYVLGVGDKPISKKQVKRLTRVD